LLKHTTYYPIMLFNQLASGAALDVEVSAPKVATKKFGDMPALDVSSSYNPETNTNVVFIVNRSQSDSIPLTLHWQALKPKSVKSARQLSGTDPKAFNSFENPHQIVPVSITVPEVKDGASTVLLPPLSFTVLEVAM